MLRGPAVAAAAMTAAAALAGCSLQMTACVGPCSSALRTPEQLVAEGQRARLAATPLPVEVLPLVPASPGRRVR